MMLELDLAARMILDRMLLGPGRRVLMRDMLLGLGVFVDGADFLVLHHLVPHHLVPDPADFLVLHHPVLNHDALLVLHDGMALVLHDLVLMHGALLVMYHGMRDFADDPMPLRQV